MGYKLANTIVNRLTAEELKEIDVVIPIPETANTSAFCVAERLKKPYAQGFVKNRYVFRTFSKLIPTSQVLFRGFLSKTRVQMSRFI